MNIFFIDYYAMSFSYVQVNLTEHLVDIAIRVFDYFWETEDKMWNQHLYLCMGKL